MSLLALLALVVVVTSSLQLLSVASAAIDPSVQEGIVPSLDNKWTVMVYLDGDNNLEEDAIDDINEMEQSIGSSANVTILVLVDRTEGYDTSNGDWTGTRLYQITSDSTALIESTLLADQGEENMGDGAVLDEFLDYCLTNYPADYYWLDLWDHGGGIDGICWDDTDGHDFLTMDEMQDAIAQNTVEHSMTFDVISHDACFMNMIEVAYELKDYADYFVASEESVPAAGFDYSDIVAQLVSDPTITPGSFASYLVDSYASSYSLTSYVTLSALNLTLMNVLTDHINNFASNLSLAVSGGHSSSINDTYSATLNFYDAYCSDLYNFVEKVIADSTLSSNYANLIAAANSLKTSLDSFIINNFQSSEYSGNANGVTVFFPTYTEAYSRYLHGYLDGLSFYAGLDWLAGTTWDEFLDDFYTTFHGYAPISATSLTLGVSTGSQSVLEDSSDYYMVTFATTGVYEISCSVYSGDADVYVYDELGLTLLAYSMLWNPDNGNQEDVRRVFTAGTYLIEVNGYFDSTYALTADSYDPLALVLDSPVFGSGGSIDGDSGEYMQVYHHFYEITIASPGEYEFYLDNNYGVDFDLAIYSTSYEMLASDAISELGGYRQIVLNVTSTTTFIVMVYGDEGEGGFELEVGLYTGESEEPETPNGGFTFPFDGFGFAVTAVAMTTLGVIALVFVRRFRK